MSSTCPWLVTWTVLPIFFEVTCNLLQVRLYSPKKVFQELEVAKEEYIQSNVKLHKEQRLLVPKNVEHYMKEMGLYPAGIAEVVDYSMLDSLRKNFQKPQHGKLWKKIEWIPHIFTFRFLLSYELIKWSQHLQFPKGHQWGDADFTPPSSDEIS